MFTKIPPTQKIHFIDLPLARLHVLEAGSGEPLIIVPATISELEDWKALVQFMAQWFHVYYFELPGHGQSEPFVEPFSSHQVAELVAQLVDHLKLEKFNLMGFSFGGLLAMRTYQRLSASIKRLILIAPCIDHRALPFSSTRRNLLSKFNAFLSLRFVQKLFYDLLHSKYTLPLIVNLLGKVGNLEQPMLLEKKLSKTKPSTIEVLNAQLNEILSIEFATSIKKHQTPCYFAMSIHDPLLQFDVTLQTLQNHFANLDTVRLYYPYHQPPKPFTYEELNHDYRQTVESFVFAHA